MAYSEPITAGENHERLLLDRAIVGRAQAMLRIKSHILCLSKSDLTVCIGGESGTGKELVAHAIHKFSDRKDMPFIKINCAAIPGTLFESEMFGFERGAFTGAYQKKQGKFELARSGTIFLDEIAEIPLSLQGKLLQVIEDKAYATLGSNTTTRVDVRILAATNADLNQKVSQGLFRLDLYHRIMGTSIHIPPLRQRKTDIPLLCDHFLKRYAACYGKEYRPLSSLVLERFRRYDWPGNVRELENALQSKVALGDVPPVFRLGEERLAPYTLKEVCTEAVRQAESRAISDALIYTNWNRRKAASLLQTSYRTLLNKLKTYGIGKT
jgi:transcriptional regulator with PAS, ATPase and Fis domain